MFLDSLIRRNRPFIEAAIELHQRGDIPANSCVLDLDTIRNNSEMFVAEARKYGLKTLAMTKQIGRNPPALRAMVDGGVDSFVAVDMECARPIHANGYKVGHIGHLVQIPRHEAAEAAALEVDYWTVFSYQKASEAVRAVRTRGKVQALLARIHAPGDVFYMGHEGGFEASDISAVAEQLDALDGASFAGITTFPALLYDEDTRTAKLTPNMTTLQKSASQLRAAGVNDFEINAPGTTSTTVLKMLADAGATQVEPGNGLAGTTPLHAVEELPERPAILYLTELSHEYAGKAYCFGGGLYIDPVFKSYQVTALVGRDINEAINTRLPVTMPPDNAIDYYGIITPDSTRSLQAGESVIFGFRQQAFVTRSLVVPISGISKQSPKIEGIWTPLGTPWLGERYRQEGR